MKSNIVTVVIPVYSDWKSLKDCIDSLIQNVDSKHKVILINDCGPDADRLEANIKARITGQRNFEYFRNDKNLGFVKTCNRAALELDKTDNHILLLNSDTKVTSGFLEEMLDVLSNNSKIGAVSPRTNNATIATIPLWAARQKGLDANKSFKIYQKMKNYLPRYTIAPVAHGFCMLIRRNLIKKYGLFDEIFGKGYGEEVDFCMRIKDRGHLSALSNRSYVFHLEAKSFTLGKKAKLLEEHNKIIRTRYPDYQQIVRDYMDKALAEEKKAEIVAGIHSQPAGENILKKLIKRNKKIHRIARSVRGRLR